MFSNMPDSPILWERYWRNEDISFLNGTGNRRGGDSRESGEEDGGESREDRELHGEIWMIKRRSVRVSREVLKVVSREEEEMPSSFEKLLRMRMDEEKQEAYIPDLWTRFSVVLRQNWKHPAGRHLSAEKDVPAHGHSRKFQARTVTVLLLQPVILSSMAVDDRMKAMQPDVGSSKSCLALETLRMGLSVARGKGSAKLARDWMLRKEALQGFASV